MLTWKVCFDYSESLNGPKTYTESIKQKVDGKSV